MDKFFHLLSLIFFFGFTIVLDVSAFIYGVFTEWRYDQVSRQMFTYLTTFAISCTYISLAFLFRWIPRNPEISTLLYASIFWVTTWRLVQIIRFRWPRKK